MGTSEKGEVFTGYFPGNEKSSGVKPVPRVKVKKDGSLMLPPEIGRKLGLSPGAKVDIATEGDSAIIQPNIHSLARVYIEPTSVCNLTCQTCIRNTWTEPLGHMKMETFNRLVEQLPRFPHLQSVMFGGFGEPTAHGNVLSMIRSIKSLGIKAEMVTNGTLLDEKTIQGLFDCRLDTLWISFDGADGAGFEDIRKGASFRQVMGGLELLQKLNKKTRHKIDLGIAFVVMRKNIEDLKNLDRLVWATGARKVSISNVLPYTEEMESQMVCSHALTLETLADIAGRVDISLPRLDVTDCTKEAFLSLSEAIIICHSWATKSAQKPNNAGSLRTAARLSAGTAKSVLAWDCCIRTGLFFTASHGLSNLTFLEMWPLDTYLRSGIPQNTKSSERKSVLLPFLPVIFAGAVITLRRTEKTVLATPFPPAGDASGHRGSYSVLDRMPIVSLIAD